MKKSEKHYTIGIDVGGTKMDAILFDGAKVLADYSLGTPKDNLEHFLIMIQALIEPLMEKARELKVKVEGIGLGVAGAIDYEAGQMLKSPNISILDGAKIIQLLAERIELPVIMDNDTNCFTRAEALLGAGKKFKNIYGMIIGTGIGGGWWVNNEIYRGAHGSANEPGRLIVDFAQKIDLEEAYHKLLQNNPAQMAEEAYRGDALASKAYTEVGEFLGLALANIVNLLDPEIIIAGGGVVESGDLFLSQARKTMQTHIMSDTARKRIKLVKSDLGKHAGAMGAALLIAQPVTHNS